MAKKGIKSKENLIKFAEQVWEKDAIIDSDTGRVKDKFLPTLSAIYKGLDRFIEAQNRFDTYQTALEEVKAGKKETHWIWYIFPQMWGLGKSERSKFYAIQNRDEAIAYINNPILRDRLVEITEAVYNSEKTMYEIFWNDAILKYPTMFQLTQYSYL
jgi:uncharacterized protein (DUF1810 family)